ncbi:hypothetical protein [Qipengyuania flava]|uniref:hypothetical protein n=1 Tax=Qipengyuania flava TaxID=192812 RepID=UPI001C625586|nr:hypothetical protein [Qipengyuania flava]QYJ07547.1 hypothetical protein KUV82_02145 [Qipengyuania flava]
MTIKTKAGRLGAADLSAAIQQAADEAKARIQTIEDPALDAVAGGIDIVTTIGGDDSDDGDDWMTDGAVMPDPFPTPDILKF